MALRVLPEELHRAGEEYLDRMKTLGLTPESLMWVYHVKENRFVLWLVWSGIDRHGPLSLSKLLFKAYQSSALPKEIDPFVVFARSPAQQEVAQVAEYVERMIRGGDAAMNIYVTLTPAPPPDDSEPLYEINREWIYAHRARPLARARVDRDWMKFQQSVEALAA